MNRGGFDTNALRRVGVELDDEWGHEQAGNKIMIQRAARERPQLIQVLPDAARSLQDVSTNTAKRLKIIARLKLLLSSMPVQSQEKPVRRC